MLIEFIKGFGLLVAYYLVFIAIAVVMRKFIDIPSEIFRKMLHLIVLASVFIFTYGFQTWWISCIAAISFITPYSRSFFIGTLSFSWFFVERKSESQAQPDRMLRHVRAFDRRRLGLFDKNTSLSFRPCLGLR